MYLLYSVSVYNVHDLYDTRQLVGQLHPSKLSKYRLKLCTLTASNLAKYEISTNISGASSGFSGLKSFFFPNSFVINISDEPASDRAKLPSNRTGSPRRTDASCEKIKSPSNAKYLNSDFAASAVSSTRPVPTDIPHGVSNITPAANSVYLFQD